MQIRRLIGAAILLGAGAVVAGPVPPPISQFEFETRTGFQNWACEGVSPCNLTGNESITGFGGATIYEHLSWGTGSNQNPFVSGGGSATDPYLAQSHLDIMNFVGGGHYIQTNGAWETINAFTHTNNVITTAGGNLGTTQINSWFQLLSPVPLSDPGVSLLTFDETLNLDSDDCPGPNPNGSACDDIFTIPGLSGTFLFYIDPNYFYSYWISFQFLQGPGASVVDNGDGTFTVYTTEACSEDDEAGCSAGEPYAAGVSTIFTQARIFTVFIPEPGTLMLFGIGALALGLRRRKR